MKQADLIWMNGELVAWEDAKVHVLTHALHYGSSVFEGERVYATHRGPAYFRLEDHTRRLFESAKVYEIEIGYTEAQINTACIELIRANQMKSAYVRPIVFRGAGGLGVLPKGEAPVDVAIMAPVHPKLHRTPLLIAVYVLVMCLPPWPLLVLALIGFVDAAFHLRRRYAKPLSSNSDKRTE